MESYPVGSEQPPYVVSSNSSNKLVVSLSFLIACLLFLLPFAEFKCMNEKFAEATGLGLATGKVKTVGKLKTLESLGNTMNQERETKSSKLSVSDPQEFAIAALGLGVLGLIISLLAFEKASKVTGFIAILCVLSMGALLFDMRSEINNEQEKYESAGEKFELVIDFTVWYYLSVLAFLSAALFSFRKKPLVQTVLNQPGEFPVTSSKVPPGAEG